MGTPQPPSKFWLNPPQVDDPVQQDGNYKMTRFDRAYIDSQILALQRKLAPLLSGKAPSGVVWTTALDLDFTTLPNQSLSTDGNKTVAGLTMVKYGSAQDRTPMVITNGVGLVVDPKQGDGMSVPPSTYRDADPAGFATSRTAPILSIPLLQIVPALDQFTAVRMWVWSSIAYGSFIAGLTDVWAQFGFENILGLRTSPTSGVMNCLQRGANSFGQCWQGLSYMGTEQLGIAQADLPGYPNDVGMLASVDGLYQSTVTGLTGLYSAGFPALRAMAPLFVANGWGASSNPGTIARVDGMSAWAVYLAGINEAQAGVASVYQGTITYKRLLIETA